MSASLAVLWRSLSSETTEDHKDLLAAHFRASAHDGFAQINDSGLILLFDLLELLYSESVTIQST